MEKQPAAPRSTAPAPRSAAPAAGGGAPPRADAALAPAPATEVSVAARELVIGIGRALHAAGSPSDRTESLLEEAARRLELEAVFFVTPTSIMASFADGTRVVRGEATDVDLGRMSALESVVTGLAPDPAAVARGRDALETVLAAPPRYRRATTRASFAGASAAAGVLLGGSAGDALLAAAAGGAVGLGLEAAARHPRLGRAFLVLASAVVSAGASLAAPRLGLDPTLVALAGLIVLLPGLSLTLAMRELAARHLVSGGARLMGAMVDFVSIAFGLLLGERAAGLLLELAGIGAATGLPAWPPVEGPVRWTALLVAPLTFVVLFRAPPRAVGAILVTCWLAWGTAGAVAAADPRLAPMLAAAAAGVLANATSRRLHMPAAVFLVPGIMLLVPGVLGMRSLDAMLDADTVGGLATAVRTVLVGTAIAAGLLVANAALPPRGSARPRPG